VLSVDLRGVMEDLGIVIEEPFRDAGITVRWEIPADLPHVWAERQVLLQALLNLTKNSQRAMQDSDLKELTIRLSAGDDRVFIRVIDTGHGVAEPARLFQPFQDAAEATGLGLYLSRAFLRAFDGDLIFEPRPAGCCFAIVLTAVAPDAPAPLPDAHARNSTVAA
jgi:signal transduction histidine kinase